MISLTRSKHAAANLWRDLRWSPRNGKAASKISSIIRGFPLTCSASFKASQMIKKIIITRSPLLVAIRQPNFASKPSGLTPSLPRCLLIGSLKNSDCRQRRWPLKLSLTGLFSLHEDRFLTSALPYVVSSLST